LTEHINQVYPRIVNITCHKHFSALVCDIQATTSYEPADNLSTSELH